MEVDSAAAADLLGDGVTEAHVRARLRRRSLAGRQLADGSWLVVSASIDESLAAAGSCGGCDDAATEYMIVKYPHHDRVEFSLCAAHARTAALSYGRQHGVIEVVTYPLQSEGWLKP